MLNAPTPAVTYNTIIPAEAQSLLIAIRNSLTNDYFLIGDLAITLCAHHAGVYEAREVQAAIAHYVGKSARSVRFYQAIAGKVPADLREELSAYDLSFAHFSFSVRFPGREMEILTWAIENNAGVDRLKVQFGKGQPLEEGKPPERIEYKNNGDLFKSLHLHLWRRADTLRLNVDQRARAKKLLDELEELFSG